MNHASCYDILQHYCEYISIQLPTLQKQRECPQEAMEAVATLIYAAARFSDLPELCDLGRLFTERYGNHMESLVNEEFVDKIQKKAFSMDKKLHTMQEITQEFSVTWDCKALQHKISNPPASVTDQSKQGTPICSINQVNEPQHASNMRKGEDVDIHKEIPYNGKFEATPRSVLQKQVQPELRDAHVVSSINKRHTFDHSDKVRKVIADEPENVDPFSKNAGIPPYTKRNGSQKGIHKDNQLKEGTAHNRSPCKTEARAEDHHENRHPYVRSSGAADGSVDSGDRERQPVRQVNSSNDSPFNLVPPPYYKPKLNNLPSKGRSNDGEHKDHRKYESSVDEKPKPVSVRRRHMKLQTVSENGSNVDDDLDLKEPDKEKVGIEKHMNRTSTGQRRHERSQKTSATYDEDCDEDEERVMDQLLVHYNKKGMDNETGRTRTRKGAPMAEIVVVGGKVVEHHTGAKVHPEAMKSVHPQRAASFLVEPISPPEFVEGNARVVSMQPEILSPCVHPRLPDYDELAARFRALKKA